MELLPEMKRLNGVISVAKGKKQITRLT